MFRLPRVALMLVALVAVGPVLAGCSSFDPDQLDFLHLGDKKPLPGKRELLFPNGVPGVTQGIPPQYEKGYQAPAIAGLPPGDTDATPAAGRTAAAAPTKPVQESGLSRPKTVHRPAAKARHRHVVKRRVKPKATATAAKPAPAPTGATAPWPSTPSQTAAQPSGAQAPWPSTPAAPSQANQAGWPSTQDKNNADQKLAPWPSAPPSGSFSKQ